MKKYFYSDGTNKSGPFTLVELLKHNIGRDTLIWHEGLDNWIKAEDIPEIFKKLKTSPPPLPKTSKKTARANVSLRQMMSLKSEVINTNLFFWTILSSGSLSFLINVYNEFTYGFPTAFFWISEYALDFVDFIAIVSLIVFCVFLYLFIYLKWKWLIKHKLYTYQDYTTGMILGYLLIPLFNYYWLFNIFITYRKRFNDVYKSETNSTIDILPSAFSIAIPILILVSSILSFVPILGSLTSAALLIIISIYVLLTAKATNAIYKNK